MKHTAIALAVFGALCAVGGIAQAQDTQAQDMETEAAQETDTQWDAQDTGTQDPEEMDPQNTGDDASTEVVPMVPTGPPVVPVAPVGPPAVPVAPIGQARPHVETVTVNTDQGPVVVLSFPVSGNVSSSDYNIDFSAIDANGDGYISPEEAQAMAGRSTAAGNLHEQFAAADVNGDGRLGFMEIIDWVY